MGFLPSLATFSTAPCQGLSGTFWLSACPLFLQHEDTMSALDPLELPLCICLCIQEKWSFLLNPCSCRVVLVLAQEPCAGRAGELPRPNLGQDVSAARVQGMFSCCLLATQAQPQERTKNCL